MKKTAYFLCWVTGGDERIEFVLQDKIQDVAKYVLSIEEGGG